MDQAELERLEATVGREKVRRQQLALQRALQQAEARAEARAAEETQRAVTEALRNMRQCQICFDNAKSMTFIPCGHQVPVFVV